MRAYSIQKIIDIIMQELVPNVSYDKKLKLYEIADALDKIAYGISNQATENDEDAFDMLACYREQIKC